MTQTAGAIPRAFIIRRLHSLFGLMMVLFLFEHFFTNSQMALLFTDDGNMFVNSVNFIKNLPYLHAIELVLIGVPFLYHGILGVNYAINGRQNLYPTSGASPSIRSGRNLAYSAQRWTAWILLVGVILHVGYFRFERYPAEVRMDGVAYFATELKVDPKLYGIADRLHVKLYAKPEITELSREVQEESSLISARKEALAKMTASGEFSAGAAREAVALKELEDRKALSETLSSYAIGDDQVVALAPNFGATTLLGVRDAFKSPLKVALYTIFVLAAVFHAFNGLWAFMITWGALLLPAAHNRMKKVAIGLMFLLGALGLLGVWGSYWTNL